MMPAAYIQPFHTRQHIAEAHLNGFQSRFERVGVLFAKSMEMKPVEQRKQTVRHLPVPDIAGNAEAAASGAGVVYLVIGLSRALGIYPECDAFSAFFWGASELFKLIIEEI